MSKALRETEQQFTRAVLEAPFPLIIHAEDGAVIQINRTWQELTGYHHSDIPTIADWTEKAYGQRKELVKADIDKLYNLNAKVQDGEYVITTAWGETRTWDFSSTPLGKLPDKRRLVLSMAVDISDRKRTEQALHESYSILLSVIEGSTDAIFMKDLQSRYLLINSAGANAVGKPVADIIGQDDTALFPLTTAYQIIENERKLITSQGAQYYEDILPINSELRTFFVAKTVCRNEQGDVIGIIGIARDISDRKRNEEALRRSEEFLRRMFASSADCVKVLDVDGRLLSMNTGGQMLMEIDDFAPFLKASWCDFWQQGDQHLVSTALEAAKTGGTGKFQAYCPTAKGTPKWWDVVVTPIMDAQGKPEQLLSVSRDITERKQAEQQIKELNQDLEKRVVERTKQLEAANKELEAFAYSVSHDLRTPLRSIDGFSLTLLERYTEQLDDKGKHYLQRVRAASQRMGELIDDLLKLSRVTRSEMVCQKIDLSVLVAAIAKEIQQTEPQRQVEFAIASPVVTQGDYRLLRVAFENLLNNAWKFTLNQTHPQIEFGTLPQPDGTDIYFIRDNGAGFDMEYADKLFGAFQRLHTVDEFPGTGIGLATVQRIIHRHGGQIWAEAAVNQGATFYFTL
ncbi:MAG: PAS domain-containing protein [Gloeocapsa sp. UFS-A4-WI-NPMV-4B04]|jgi:PAS domain S-box-containing protein|nr:PAS domain-containing protein [Gloeocapsa sp. UFS-A4-WI-NPMV-4B04]